ncbi:hypothetical protein LCGC14_0344200 [marine sediment metagenome]|uniref:Uncharacterized protein n=1 Tax=marine sediment metagenome TaxID=412755 RepID=A0A0F9TCH9_9ZZZZ
MPVGSITFAPNPSPWDSIVDLRHFAEDAYSTLYETLIEDRHVLEARISLLERTIREQGSEIARLSRG